MLCDENCRTAVFGKTERAVGWEGNGETLNVKASETLCLGYLQITDRLLLLRHCVYSGTPTDNGYALAVVAKPFLYPRFHNYSPQR